MEAALGSFELMEDQLRKWGSRLGVLSKRADRSEGAGKQSMLNRIKALNHRRSRAKARLSLLKSTPYDAANWQQLRIEAEETYVSLADAMRNMRG